MLTKRGYYELIFASIVMIIFAIYLFSYSQLSTSISYLSALLTISFFLLAFVYLVSYENKNASAHAQLACDVLFSLCIVFFLLSIFINSDFAFGMVTSLVIALNQVGTDVVMFLFVFFSFFFGAFFFRAEKNRTIGLLFMLLGLIIMWAFFISGHIDIGLKANDETLLTIYSIKAFLNGTNPYTYSLLAYLYQHHTTTGLTLLTTNTIASIMDYPALFFLSYLPFYLISPPNLANISVVYLGLYSAVSLTILLFVLVFCIRKKALSAPIFSLIVVLAIAITYIASIATYLALALLVLAYAKIDNKYAGIIIGLGFAIQQEIWLPLVLLLIYSYNNYGSRKFLMDVGFAALAFLAVNGYFIALNPAAFFQQVLVPSSGSIFPDASAPIGYLILQTYNIPLSYFPVLATLVFALLAVILVYVNEKRLIGLFAIVVLTFLQRGLGVYYSFFIFFFILTLFIDSYKARKPVLKTHFIPNRNAFYGIAMFIVLVIGGLIYAGHLDYLNTFNVSITNQSLVFYSNGNHTIYNSDLVHGNLKNSTVYVFAEAYADDGFYLYGLENSTIIASPKNCAQTDYHCLINRNEISLNGSHMKGLLLVLNPMLVNQTNSSNVTRTTVCDAYYVEVYLYDSGYFYAAPPYHNNSIERNDGGC